VTEAERETELQILQGHPVVKVIEPTVQLVQDLLLAKAIGITVQLVQDLLTGLKVAEIPA
jgi:hypothetical protein